MSIGETISRLGHYTPALRRWVSVVIRPSSDIYILLPPLTKTPSNPRPKKKNTQFLTRNYRRFWWYKVEPLASIIRDACFRLYTPSSDVLIDELMIRCYGCSQYTYKTLDKPIPMGYKLFRIDNNRIQNTNEVLLRACCSVHRTQLPPLHISLSNTIRNLMINHRGIRIQVLKECKTSAIKTFSQL